MTQQLADEFAEQWIDSWNSHDIDRIMVLYADNVDFYSPMIIQLGVNDEGRIQGKTLLSPYFGTGLNAYPELKFTLHHVFCGIDSLVIQYESVSGKLAAEIMQLDAELKISHVQCHYQKS